MVETMQLQRIRGLIFDMDNTLLQSRIDFPAMKRTLYQYIVDQGILGISVSVEDHTSATLIQLAQTSPVFDAVHESALWEICAEFELKGMESAALEPFADDVLVACGERCCLTVLTNNAQEAAERALTRTEVFTRFDAVFGRELAGCLKPSSGGVERILSQFPAIPREEWLLVGDAWIDGMAAQGAGVHFLAYRPNVAEMVRRGVKPIAVITDLRSILTNIP